MSRVKEKEKNDRFLTSLVVLVLFYKLEETGVKRMIAETKEHEGAQVQQGYSA